MVGTEEGSDIALYCHMYGNGRMSWMCLPTVGRRGGMVDIHGHA